MRLFIIFMLLAGSVFADTTETGSLVVNGQVGYGHDVGRTDAGLVVKSLKKYDPLPPGSVHRHAMIDLDLDIFPCDPAEEVVYSASGRDAGGSWVQMGTISWMFSGGCSSYNGYSVLRLNAATPGGSSDIGLRLWAFKGIGLFRNGDNDTCGGRWLCITRQPYVPSIAGKTDLVLEANMNGVPDKVLINSFNSGDVVLAIGGGNIQWGPPLTLSGPANTTTPIGWMQVKANDGSLFWVPAYR